MALSPALLHSAASTFNGQFSVLLPPDKFSGCRSGVLPVKAMSSVILVEKTDAEKVNRLKTSYLEKIVPLLKEEFNYANVHQVMYSFLDRLINLGLPRTRDFQGVNSNSFDGNGNYSIGIREQSVFPEIGLDVLGKLRGMDVCIATTADTDKEAHRLLALMGMPFKEGGGPTTVAVRKKKLKSHHFDSKSKSKQRTNKK